MPFNPQGNIAYGAFQQIGTAAATATSLSVTLGAPVTQENLLVALVAWQAATGTVSTVTDSVGGDQGHGYNTLGGVSAFSGPNPNLVSAGALTCNTWMPCSPVFQALAMSMQAFYVPNAIKGGIETVTVALSASQSAFLAVAEYFGGGKLAGNPGSANGNIGVATANAQTTAVASGLLANPQFFEWDRASAFQGALAQSQIQTPGILLFGGMALSTSANLTINSAVSGCTSRGTFASVYGVGDSGSSLLTVAGFPAQNIGYSVTYSAVGGNWLTLAVPFFVPSVLGHPQ